MLFAFFALNVNAEVESAVADQGQGTEKSAEVREQAKEPATSQEVNQETAQYEESLQQSQEPKRKGPFFSVWEFRVEGNTLLSGKTIELALTPYLGPSKNIDDIYEASDRLKEVYRVEGYPSIDVVVPPQDIVNGVVKFEVLEGSVARLRVSGSRYFSLRKIKDELKSVRKGEPVHIPSFQKDINRLNRKTPNLRVTPVFKQGKEPGTIEIDLRVRDKFPVNSSVELNNHATKNTTESRLSASVGYDNLWLENHSWSLQVQTSPEDTDEVKVLATTYIFPGFDSAAKVALYAVKSDSEISAVGDSVVIGNGEIFGFRYVSPLNSSRTYLHSISAGLDYKDFGETISVLGADSGSVSRPISYAAFTGLYNGTLIGKNSSTKLGFGLTFGIRNFPDTSEESEFDAKRLGAKTNFIHLQAKVNRQDRFSNDWRINSRAKAQLSDSPLISNEQFSAGGNKTVRGYYESQQLGDDGIIASVELESKSFASSISNDLNNLRFNTFIDAAYLVVQDEIQNFGISDGEYSLTSFGVGFRLKAFSALSANVEIGYPLEDSPDVDSGDIKAHASIEYEF